MMGRTSNSSSSSKHQLFMLVGALVVLIGGYFLWALMGTSVQLEEDGYQMTVALFRICNQQDTEGLEKIRELVKEAKEKTGSQSQQMAAIDSIIQLADSGHWKDASKQTRILMDAQIQH